MFKIGESGWMNVPTRAAHYNWEIEDESEAHVVLTDTDKDGVGETLIFYYDDVDHSQEGRVFELTNTYYAYPFWNEYSSNITNVIFDSGFNYAKPTCTDLWFSECSKLTSISGIKYLDTSAVTSMYGMFEGCSSLTSLDVSNFNTEAVIDMGQMFAGCSSLTGLDVSSFNTAAVTSMSGMFQNCSGLTSLNVSGFNTTAVTSMEFMFASCSSLTSLNVSSFNTAAVTSMLGMFGGCSSLTRLDISSFNTDAVTNMSMMFSSCSSVSSLDVSSFNTASVTSMLNMFCDCSSLTRLDVSGFNTVSVKDMAQMFYGCSGLTKLDVSGFNTMAVRKLNGMFSGCSSLTSLDVSGFNTEAVTDMSWMFEGCSSLTSLDVSGFNTAAVTSMFGMFQNCSGLTSLDVSGFNTAAVNNMMQMFCDCSSLTGLDISNFVISSETTISSLFVRCFKLLSINVGNNDFSANGTDNNVFWGVGSSSSPCNLIINSDFDKSVLGDFNGRYYRWRGGYFAEPTMEQSDLNYEYVDLGLPSGTLWATTDLGSNNIHKFGNLYAWGETSSKNEFSNNNYTYTGGSPLPLSSDAAYVNMGVNWRMPTKIEWQELIDNCTWDYYFYNDYDACLLGTSNINGKTITFCLKDYYADEESDSDYYSCYWSKEEFSNLFARAFNVHLYDSNGWYYCSVFETREYKYNGLLIRAVRNK